jgi:hypothetical protein
VTAALEHLLATAPEQPGLRLSAIRALGRLRWAAAVPHLVASAHSDDTEIRQAASEALVRIGGELGRDGPGAAGPGPRARDPEEEARIAARLSVVRVDRLAPSAPGTIGLEGEQLGKRLRHGVPAIITPPA